jgi:hypothetical protein
MLFVISVELGWMTLNLQLGHLRRRKSSLFQALSSKEEKVSFESHMLHLPKTFEKVYED